MNARIPCKIKSSGILYPKISDESERAVLWWSVLSKSEKEIIMSIPNFDKEIFEEITGIDVDD